MPGLRIENVLLQSFLDRLGFLSFYFLLKEVNIFVWSLESALLYFSRFHVEEFPISPLLEFPTEEERRNSEKGNSKLNVVHIPESREIERSENGEEAEILRARK